jgi:dTDP-4-amino-4,6-dideoxygalactose transaminase
MSKPIFNSLGSNYTFSFAMLSLRQLLFAKKDSLSKVTSILSQRFDGHTYLFYKGRDAIEYGLRAVGVGPGDSVLTQAFTCHAIEEAILRSGAQPVFVDLEAGELNPSIRTLEEAWKRASKPKALLIQHTLGYPADVPAIREWCTQRKVFLIEDLAQSFGACDLDGRELGTLADIVICSFGRDKIIDAVSGGACIIKHNSMDALAASEAERSIEVDRNLASWIILRDLLYPFVTWFIRATHHFIVGKFVFQVAKKIGLLSSPIDSPTKKITLLSPHYAELILYHLNNIEEQLNSRRKRSDGYITAFQSSNFFFPAVKKSHLCAAHLRFPIQVDNPQQLSDHLAKQDIYLSDRWYRQAVDCGTLQRTSTYVPGSCPNAEQLATRIFNLPTHQGIDASAQQRIITTLMNYYNGAK